MQYRFSHFFYLYLLNTPRGQVVKKCRFYVRSPSTYAQARHKKSRAPATAVCTGRVASTDFFLLCNVRARPLRSLPQG